VECSDLAASKVSTAARTAARTTAPAAAPSAARKTGTAAKSAVSAGSNGRARNARVASEDAEWSEDR
jgi:hypothetical protein